MYRNGEEAKISLRVWRMMRWWTSSDFGASIHEVIKTLIRAFILVFIVVYIFLAGLRSTHWFRLLRSGIIRWNYDSSSFSIFGFSINFWYIYIFNHSHPLWWMMPSLISGGQNSNDSGAILISITLVMAAVFIPVTFMVGTSGVFYAVWCDVSCAIVISAVNALTLVRLFVLSYWKPAPGRSRRGRNLVA